jgi:hypothetical protein
MLRLLQFYVIMSNIEKWTSYFLTQFWVGQRIRYVFATGLCTAVGKLTD